MSYIETSVLKNSTIMLLYSEIDEIKFDPEYQRMGGVWTIDKKQLLIDSILNDYDLPKIYFHLYDTKKFLETGIKYAVIDGRQRLETIRGFIEGEFNLSNDFEYQRDDTIKLAGLSYNDIAKQYPKIRVKFDSFVLPIVTVSTLGNDLDLIEDMFARLNEASPLNAAEKRNAFGGFMVRAISELSGGRLFINKVRFSNSRYQHKEVAARFLVIEDSISVNGKLIDTKKVYLDAMAKKYREEGAEHVNCILQKCLEICDCMCEVFSDNDELLNAQGNLTIYYLIFKSAMISDELDKISRRKLLDFREKLRKNRQDAEENYADSSYDLLEYDRLSQQGTNDSSNLKERARILASELNISFDPIWAK
ncbi:DUF262 domain-containing protein [Kiloniella laminariae]|uniref:DUF262 domain-containing protein n=1 Tax=Kiloniella laminariae TaxID=454162 RepID=UPI00036A1FB8|nr:DUF262 domain-containing protein [Kiloniella laminariae]